MNKTYSQKPSEVSRRWILIDAKDAPLGRVATTVATYLTGKYKPSFTPHVDGGDYVIVINAKEAVGIKSATLKEVREKAPEFIIENAVKGMIPHNKLAKERMARLKIFAGENHSHEAQKPEKVEVK